MNATTFGPRPEVIFKAFAPGGIGNIGPGLDILGCALTGPGDFVEARIDREPGVRIEEPGLSSLPRDARRHASGVAALEVLRLAGRSDVGLTLWIEKGLPLAGGQGGSAASAVAGAVATNAALGYPLDESALIRAALAAEEHVAGRHVDNIVPCLVGGIVLIRRVEPLDFIRIPAPAWLRVALVRPDMTLTTKTARSILPAVVDRATALEQAAAVSSMIAAFCLGDAALLRGAVEDRIAEPAREHLIPGFRHVKHVALDAGALGCSISGGGPSIFALTDGDDTAIAAMRAMISAFESNGVRAEGRVASIDERGARLVETQ